MEMLSKKIANSARFSGTGDKQQAVAPGSRDATADTQLNDEDLQRVMSSVPGGATNVADVLPLSTLQEGILFHCLLSEQSDLYVASVLLAFDSRVQLARWLEAINAVVARHDVLRTTLRWEGLPKPVQVVLRSASMPVHELTLEEGRDPIEYLKERMKPGRQPRVDLLQAPMAGLYVVSGTDGRCYCQFTIHHLISDLQSMRLLINESFHYLDDPDQELAPPQPYKEYLARANARVRLEGAETFFKSRLGDVEEPTAPFGLFEGSVAIEESSRLIDPEVAGRIRAHCTRFGVTAARLCHAAWALVVAGTSGKDDVVFGTVLSVAQRKAGRATGMGLLLNTLPLRVNLAELSVAELVQNTQRELSQLLRHVHMPLPAAQRCSGIRGNEPVFTSIINYRHSRHEVEWRSRSGVEVLLRGESPTGYVIAFSVDDWGDGFRLGVLADSRIHGHRVIDYFERALQSLVQALEEAPQAPALSLSILPEAERRQVLQSFNATQSVVPRDKLLHELFEEQVRRTPGATAVVYEGQSLTYAGLNGRANQLARYLRNQGVGSDQLVGICVERGVAMIVAVLGVLKAGGAYVPLDPTYPAERLAYLLEDAAPQVLLTLGQLRERLPPTAAAVIALDEQWSEIAAWPAQDLDPRALQLTSRHLAYVIYTSGSTGQPKGVMIEHGNVTNLWQGLERAYRASGPFERAALNASLNFDASVQQLVQLLSGRTLYIIPQEFRRDPALLVNYVAGNRIQALDCTPSQLKAWMSAGLLDVPGVDLRVVLVGGEAIDPQLWRGLAAAAPLAFLNVYGPTECTVDATLASLKGDRGAPHIGAPMENRRIYVLDAHRQPVPIGVAGELYIGGAGVARGYLNREELTQERFVTDPFSTDSQARMYKTGDLGRWRADGNIEYLGRNDQQVKIRGFRIELGEIEAQLTRHTRVKEAVVLARQDVPGESRLVAYVVAHSPCAQETPLAAEVLRAYLKTALPEYMVPSAFVMLEQLPHTASGKLDRRALPAPELGAYGSRQYLAPQGEIEEILAGIWQELLGVERVGRSDNFFELGGHSLLIVQMLERLRRVGVSTPVRRVFDSPTLADLAAILTKEVVDPVEVPPNLIPPDCERITPDMLPLVQLEVEHIERIAQAVPEGAANIQDIYPLAALQEGILFHHLLNPQGGDAYARVVLLAVDSHEHLQQLLQALQAVIDRHDILRTAVLWEQLPRALQVVHRRASLRVEEIVLRADRPTLEQLEECMQPQRLRLDLRQAPLLRVQTAADPHSEQWYALLQTHHLVCDNGSLDILFTEVKACIEARAQSLPAPIPYRIHVAQTLGQARTEETEAFFRGKLGDVEEPTAPFGMADIQGDGSAIESVRQTLPEALARGVRLQARRLGVSAATVFHAAWGLVLAHTSGCEDVVFGSVLLGRLHGSAGAQRVLGMFINTLPLRLRLRQVGAQELVEQTQRELIDLLVHEQASLAVAQRCSGIAGSSALFSALLNYRHSTGLGTQEAWLDVAGMRVLSGRGGTNYPLVLSVDDSGAGFELEMQTDRRLEPTRVLGLVCAALQSLVRALDEAPRTPALVLSILPEAERRQVLELFNTTDSAYPEEKLIHELFEEQVERDPEAVAVICEDQSINYAELNQKANQLARYLTQQGAVPGELIPILMPRSPRMLIAQLAVLKVGAAYVPIDPEFPLERQAFMLRDCAARRVLADCEPDAELRKEPLELQWIDCTAAGDAIAKAPVENFELKLDSPAVAYVMYTSGSTGEPKGVIVPHHAVSRLVINNGYTRIEPDDCFAHCSNPAFDASTFEIWGALLNGARVAIMPHSVVLDAQRFAQALQRQRVTVLWLTAGLFAQSVQSLAAVFGQLRYLLVGGDVVSPDAVRQVLRSNPPRHLLNGYGPTEGTTFSATYAIEAVSEDARSIPIGRPIANTRIYILDARLNPVPVGAAGEIYIGGAGVALGYLNREALTAERFLRDPFSADRRARIYKTGDLGRWRPDGAIEYLGRNDHQVKIRGFRIELGEIEAQLARHEHIKEAAVIAREDIPGEKRLVAYVVARDAQASATPGAAASPESEAPLSSARLSPESLRAYLKPILPDYMLPNAFVCLRQLPLTTNGKLDRRALPAPERVAYGSRAYEAPQGEIETALANIWQALLRVERVGRTANFFALGGHSLLIVQMLERLRQVGLSAPPIHRVLDSSTLADLAAALTQEAVGQVEVPPNLIPPGCEQITPRMLPLVQLQAEHIERIAQAVPGGAANIQDIYPLASLQEGILFHHLLDPEGGDAYARVMLFSLESREHLQRLLRALQTMIDRHDMLRTAVLWEQLPQMVQVVYRRASLPVEEIVLQPRQPVLEQLEERMQPQRQRLDLRQSPLMRVQIAADPHSEQWYAVLQTHHLVCDNGSLDILFAEVRACIEGREQSLPPPMPYRSHVAQTLHQARTGEAEAFFARKLGDVEEPTAPFGLLDVQGDGTRVESAQQALPDPLARRLRLQARRLGVSPATVFHAVWALVLAHTSAREDVVFGSVLLGRLQSVAGAQRILGMFINTLPLRLRLQEVGARQLVERTQRELIELLAHEQASLAVAQRCSGIAGSSPLFSTLLNYRHSTVGAQGKFPDAEGVRLLASRGGTNYPVVLSVDDTEDGFGLEMETDRRIDPKRMLGFVCAAAQSLVQALEEAPLTAALSLSILPESERRQVLELFQPSPTPTAARPGRLIHELFEEQVQRTPNTVAAVYEGESLSYAELNRRANQLARHLRSHGVGPDQLVGICVERGLEMVVGLLGILKAGGAYLPLDPSYPAERLAYMLADAAPRVLLIQEPLRAQLPQIGAEVIALDSGWASVASQETDNLPPDSLGLHAHHLAYVIYTSGSTGQPKGVMIEHANVSRLFASTAAWFDFNEHDVWTLFHSFAFDFSVWELWGALLHGGRVVVVPRLTARSPEEFYRLICAQGVTVLNQTPSAFAQLIPAQSDSAQLRHRLRVVIFGGEALELHQLRPWVRRNGVDQPELVNMYGITETTVHVTYARLREEAIESDRSSPIGQAIPDLRIYLLDRNRQPVPIGVPGEIHVAGAGVARGYLNRAELTAERFLEDPFSGDPSGRMYKSGDLGKWRADGTLEYLGRNDHQVKIRGFRIELGEIEAQLSCHEQIQEAAVIAREDVPGEKRLVAYVVATEAARSEAGLSAEALRAHLKPRLPDYMLPSAFVMLQRLPLTAHGKLDRKALPAVDAAAYLRRQYAAPQGEVEEILAGIWQELLCVEQVGRNDNFFELGGHSLLIVQVLERLRRVGLSAQVRQVFDSPTLAELSAVLRPEGVGQVEVPPNLIPSGCEHITPLMLPLVQLETEHIERIARAVPGGAANIQDIYPLTALQKGILFHHLMAREGGDTYVVAMVLSVASRQRLEDLIAALQTVIDRHDILRTAVLWEQIPEAVQVVYRKAALPVEESSLQPDRDVMEQVREWMQPERQRLDLRQAPLMRLQVAADPHAAQWYVLLQLHHLTCDHVTMEIIVSEVVTCLQGRAGELLESVPYRNHVAQALAHAGTHDAESFFRDKLGDVDEPTTPFGLLDAHDSGGHIEEAREVLQVELSRRIRAQARRAGVSAATLFHAAWSLVVAQTSGRDNVVFGSVLLGRLQGNAGAQQILGMFINTLPLRLELRGVSSKELVEQTQRELIELLGHEQASLALAQSCSAISGSTPLFSALLNYRHSPSDPQEVWSGAAGVQALAAQERTNYPVAMSVDDFGEGFALTAQTDRRVDPRRVTAYLHTAIDSLVQALEQQPHRAALSLSILPEAERRQVLELFNTTDSAYPKEKLIHELFEEQVHHSPNAIAATYEGQSLSYAELNSKANQLARHLRGKGVAAEQLVAICMERSLEMVIAIMGVWKAGGAYVPLDPAYPIERIGYMLQDSSPKVLIIHRGLSLDLPTVPANVVRIDDEWPQISKLPHGDLRLRDTGLTPRSLAYVIYTSGSTGQPKGAMAEHRGLCNLACMQRQSLDLRPRSRVLQFASLSFDACAWEVVMALCSGARLHLARREDLFPGEPLLRTLRMARITHATLPPAVLSALPDAEGLHLTTLVSAGEACTAPLAQRWSLTQQFINAYGPTEATVCASFYRYRREDGASLPIGGPIANARIYILGAQLQPLPVGVAGEIYIGGAGVGRGYLNRPDLTLKSFLSDPFSADSQARMYKTGDLGRWRPDGAIEYLGRNDHQVKIRGFRIELGEIETQLTGHEKVKGAVVLAREDVPGEKRLVAYVTAADEAPSADALRAHLKGVLPEYMVPSAFVVLETFPLTPNGKLDLRALPAPEPGAYGSRAYEAPQGEIEEVLSGIWQKLLHVERIGRNDNIFDLGGHSLHILVLIPKIAAELAVDLQPIEAFNNPTIAKLSAVVAPLRATPKPNSAPAKFKELVL